MWLPYPVKSMGIREFCNVTPSSPSPHSVVLHRGGEALMHVPYHSETVVRDVHVNVWKVTESAGGEFTNEKYGGVICDLVGHSILFSGHYSRIIYIR